MAAGAASRCGFRKKKKKKKKTDLLIAEWNQDQQHRHSRGPTRRIRDRDICGDGKRFAVSPKKARGIVFIQLAFYSQVSRMKRALHGDGGRRNVAQTNGVFGLWPPIPSMHGDRVPGAPPHPVARFAPVRQKRAPISRDMHDAKHRQRLSKRFIDNDSVPATLIPAGRPATSGTILPMHRNTRSLQRTSHHRYHPTPHGGTRPGVHEETDACCSCRF